MDGVGTARSRELRLGEETSAGVSSDESETTSTSGRTMSAMAEDEDDDS